MARRRGVRFTGKFYMLLALMLVAVTVAVVLLLSDSGGGTLETGTMRMELAVKGIVIRDEMSVTVDKYDKVMFQAAEGAESYEGMPIARVFKWGYSDDMMQSLITVETQIYEAQTALQEAIRTLDAQTLTLDKLTAHKKRELAITFGELVYDGQWFSPLRKALSAFVTSTQEHVTGKVRLELYKGNLINAGVWSPYSLYREDIATFAAGGDYKQSDATGFISIYGLPTKVQALREQGKL